MKLSTKFDYSSVAYNVDNTVHLLVQATAPKIDVDKNRIPLNLVATLDVSPSMEGPKIEYARKSLMKLIDHLSPEDTLGLVSFDSEIRTLFSPTKMDQKSKDQFKQLLQRTGIGGGGTNISGAILESFRHANQIDGAARVILFTDGQPNVGVSTQQLPELLRQNMRKNLSLTSFGYGSDHDSKLLTELAEVGKGNYAYLENPDDALTAFARELGGLLSCYGQNLKFAVTPKEKTEIVEVLSDVDVEEIPEGGVLISIPDLYSEETRNIVLKLKLDRQPKSHPRATSVAEVVLKYDRMPEGKKHSEDVRAKVQFVKLQDVQKNADQEVVDQVALCQIMQAQQQATVYASSGNFMMANTVMDSLTLGVAGVQGAYACSASSAPQSAMQQTKGYFGDQMSFTNSGHLRSASSHSHRSGRASHSSNMGLYVSNTSMNSMVESFKDDDQPIQGGAQGIAGIGQLLGQGGTTLQGQGGVQSVSGAQSLQGAGALIVGQGGSVSGSINLGPCASGGGSGSNTGSFNLGDCNSGNGSGGTGIPVAAAPGVADTTSTKSKTKSRSKKEW
jgi:Ca-activated chloride channel family protein